ncbi:MAG: phage tail tape measure protein [Oscillospiraceae bacterium]|nr:phage tail tape measure protein [Oscillospiraceae bacterium]MBR3239844.1 phage tail tape measure protein [Oscillospiraceae bacterium]
MADRIKGITIEINGDTTKLSKALDGVNRDLKTTQSNLRDVEKLLKMDPGNVTLLKQKQELLTTAIEKTKEKLDKEKEALAQLKSADQTPEVKAQMEALERQIAEDEQRLKSLKEESKNFGSVASQQFKAVGGAMQEIGDKVKEVGDKVTSFGEDVTKNVTGPIMAAAGASVAAFAETDKALDIIVKKTGATGEAAEGFGDIMNNIATTIPTDFETAASAIGEINTRFHLTGDDLETLSTQFVKFSSLTGSDVSGAVDKAQKALAAYGLGAEDAGAYLDRLTLESQKTGVDVGKLMDGLVSNSAAFKDMGLSIDQATVFMSELETSGANSETVLNGMRKALKNAAAEGKPLNQALFDLQFMIEHGKGDMDGLTAAYDLFGKSGDQIYAAVKGGTVDFTNLFKAVDDADGTIENTFAQTVDPITDFKTTLNEAKVVMSEVGATLLETLKPVIEQVVSVVQQLKEKWESLSPETQQAIAKAAMLAAAIGPVIMIVGTLISSIGTIISVGGTLISGIGSIVGVLGGPLTAAIAAVIAIGVLLYENWDTICAWVEQMKEKIVAAWNVVKEKVTAAATAISNTVKEKWNAVKTNVSNAMNAAKSTVSNALGAMKSAYQNAGGGIKGIVSGWMAGVKSIISSGFDVINSLTGGRLTAVKDKFVSIFNGIKDAVHGIIEKIKGFFNFTFQVPKLKLPHFTISPAGWKLKDLLEGIKPSLSIEWYKRAYNNPVMFNTPTVVPTANGLMGFGDGVGGEIVVGAGLLTDMIQAPIMSLATRVDRLTGLVAAIAQEGQKEIYLNGRELTRGLKSIGVQFNG